MWKDRYMFIFHNIKPCIFHISSKIIAFLPEFCKDDKLKNLEVYIRPSLDEESSIGYFDRDEKHWSYGAKTVLNIRRHNSIRLWMSVGNCSNTHVELLSLWGLLWFSKKRGILEIEIVGASKVFIDLANDSSSMHTLTLEHWMNRVKLLILHFDRISFLPNWSCL